MSEAAPWPRPLAEPALRGLAGDVVRTLEPHTEADPAALLAHLLVSFGSAAGSGPHVEAEGARHGTNLYAVIVGESAKARKGTARARIRRIVNPADPQWADERTVDGLASGEGLIWGVRDALRVRRPANDEEYHRADEAGMVEEVEDPGVDDKRLLVETGEFVSVLKVMGREGNTLSPVIRELWDQGRAQTLSKNRPAKTSGAHVSIVGHITHEEFTRHLNGIEAGNGFANRFLFVCAKRSKLLPFGGDPPEEATQGLVNRLTEALRFARSRGRLQLEAEARELWVRIYTDLSASEPGLFGSVTSRGEPQVTRLAVIYAMLDRSPSIAARHLEAAQAFWRYSADSARYVFGTSTGDPLADKIEAFVRERGEASRTDLRELVGHRLPAAEIDHALSLLEGTKRLWITRRETGGRPVEIMRPTGTVEVTEITEQSPAPEALSSLSSVPSTRETYGGIL